MESYFEKEALDLYRRAIEFIDTIDMSKAINKGEKLKINIADEYKRDFFQLVDKVNLKLMEDKENFYGYFLFQMAREIRFDISSPTAVNFKGAKYVVYFNPIIFLQLNINAMGSSIKHEIHHILSNHLLRAKEFKGKISTLATNMAMDIVANQYLDYLPPYSVTLKWVNSKYELNMEPYNTFEYYAQKIQEQLNLQDEDEDGEVDDSQVEDSYDIERTHDIWDEMDDLNSDILREFTEKYVSDSEKGIIPIHIQSMILGIKNSKGELPWNLYLKKLMGTIESNKKKTVTRRNRRQPDRMDLRGVLRNHKAEVAVAIDISGSISDEEFKQAIKEVLSIVKNYNHEITIIECDKEIKSVYKVKNIKDIRERSFSGGGTKFTPVFEYANSKNINLLIYFTDGKGENKLEVKPKSYKTLWVLSGRGDKLSLKESYGTVKKLSKVKVKDNIVDMKDVRNDGYSMNNQEPIF